MGVRRSETIPIRTTEDIVSVRQRVRAVAAENAFNLVEQTKLITAASELARNAVVHGGGGEVTIEELNKAQRAGIRLTFEDRGPGIPDIQLAMKDGYSTRNGLGLGLGGARRLSNDFEIVSRLGEGTRVSITRWKNEP